MNTYIHRVTNQSEHVVLLMVLNKLDHRSYDLVLGPGQSVDYDTLYGKASAPVPVAGSAVGFLDSHIRVRVGDTLFALYDCEGKVRHVEGACFDDQAPLLEGFSGPGPMELLVRADATIVGKVMVIASGPTLAAVAWANSRYALYAIGRDENTLVQKPYLATQWDGWSELGKPAVELSGKITAVSWADYRYSIFALGIDGLIYEKSWLINRWDDWTPHAAPAESKLRDLSAVKWATGRYGIYAIGEDGKLYQKWWGLNQLHPWVDMGKPETVTLTGPVTAVCWGSYRYGIYALGSDDQVWLKWYGVGWSDWVNVGSPESPLKSLTSVSSADRHCLIAGIGKDGNLWTRDYRNDWADAWVNQGQPEASPLSGSVAAVSWMPGVHACYAQGADGLTYRFQDHAWCMLDGK
jgi:hypothetical protein